MFYNDFTLIYMDRSKNLLGTSSAKKNQFPFITILLFFLPNYMEFYQLKDGYL